MKLSKRSMLVVVSLMLAMSLSVFSTVAYLTSSAQATNTFTVGDVNIDLDETDVDENGDPKYPVDTDDDGEPDVEVSIDEDGVITIDPTPGDDSDDPIIIEPDDNGEYPDTDIDGDGDKDKIEVDEDGNIHIKPEGGEETVIVPDTDVEVDDDGTITITPDGEDPIVIVPDENGEYPDTDVNGDGVDDKITVDEDGNIHIEDGATGGDIVIEPDRDDENEYNIVPGKEYVKDPTVTVKEGSEKSYVRMRVVLNNYAALKELTGDDGAALLANFVTVDTENWTIQGNGTADGDNVEFEFWYKEPVSAKTGDEVLPPLFETFSVPGTFEREDLQELVNFKMDVFGEAIQAATFETAFDAWAAFDDQHGN